MRVHPREGVFGVRVCLCVCACVCGACLCMYVVGIEWESKSVTSVQLVWN